MERRTFLKSSSLSAAGGLTILNLPLLGKNVASNKVVAIMGVNRRGSYRTGKFSQIPGVEVTYTCDIENGTIKNGLNSLKDAPRKRLENEIVIHSL